jgi:DNA phosphorothioation-dependent restriction protein DptF
MIKDINQGYRPNRYDKNNIIIFQELIDRIIDKLKVSKKLIIINADNREYLFKNIDNDEIEVRAI